MSVPAGIGSDAPQLALVEQVSGVVQGRDVAEVDSGNREGSTAVEGAKRYWHKLANGCERMAAPRSTGGTS